MSVGEHEPRGSRSGAGAIFDAWFLRMVKLIGAGAAAMSCVLAAFGHFEPIMFGLGLTVASGGFVGDAWQVIKPGRG